jgi:uncharacterized membrane protein
MAERASAQPTQGWEVTQDIDAPIWRVYEAISHLERLTEFFPDVVRVQPLADGNTLLYIDPGNNGLCEWVCQLLERSPNKRIVWEAYFKELVQTGEVCLQAFHPRITRITVTICHMAPDESPLRQSWRKVTRTDFQTTLKRGLEKFRETLETETSHTRSESTEG